MAGKPKSLKWYGKAVTEKMEAAQIAGVNETMGECVVEAKRNHPWQNRTATLERQIGIATYGRAAGGGVRGTWGVLDLNYARILEEGGTITPKKGKYLKIPQPDGSYRQVTSVTIPPYPYLRPAADRHYGDLAKRIRQAFERQSKDP